MGNLYFVFTACHLTSTPRCFFIELEPIELTAASLSVTSPSNPYGLRRSNRFNLDEDIGQWVTLHTDHCTDIAAWENTLSTLTVEPWAQIVKELPGLEQKWYLPTSLRHTVYHLETIPEFRLLQCQVLLGFDPCTSIVPALT